MRDKMSSLLVKNIVVDGQLSSIYCKNGKIEEIGIEKHADEVFDGRGCIAHPPFLNSHTHASMTLFRGNGDDLPLMDWLQTRVWPYEKQISFDEIYWGAKLAMVEMIRSGTTFFADMYWNFHAVAKGVEEMGMRACLSAVFIDFDSSEVAQKQIKANERLLVESKEYSDHISFAVAPHAIYTVNQDSYRWAAEFTREHNLILHTHLSETAHEVEECLNKNGCTPVEYLESMGCVSNRLMAAHTVHLTENDIHILGENRVMCMHNPVSNMKLAVGGVYPYRKLKKAGAIPSIATDGAGSNNNLDILEEMKIAALLQKHNDIDPTSLSAREAIEMTTENPARFFDLDCVKIRKGGLADFILIDTGPAEMNPMFNLESHLVYAANSQVVDSVICDGKLLMRHREIEGAEEIIAKANEAAESMYKRIDG